MKLWNKIKSSINILLYKEKHVKTEPERSEPLKKYTATALFPNEEIMNDYFSCMCNNDRK